MVQAVRGETAAWGVVVPIGGVTIVVLVLLGWLLGSIMSTDAVERPGPAPRASGATESRPARS
jgi:hypothetical protein